MRRNYSVYAAILLIVTVALWMVARSYVVDYSASCDISTEPVDNRLSPYRTDIRKNEQDSIKTDDSSLSFLMMNACRYILGTNPNNSKPIKSEESKQALIQTISVLNPDCVGLCEIGDESALDDIANRLKNKGIDYSYRYFHRGVDDQIGLGFLSKRPILENRSVSQVSLPDGKMMLRGILDISVGNEAMTKYRFVGIHFKSKWQGGGIDIQTRKNESLILRKHLDEQGAPNNLIVYGDFNDGIGSGITNVVRGVQGDMVLNRLKSKDSRGETWTYYYAVDDVYSCIDHIFVSRDIYRRLKQKKDAAKIIDTPEMRKASDHRAVLLTLP